MMQIQEWENLKKEKKMTKLFEFLLWRREL